MDAPYATIADLRAEGLDEATVADDRALDLILLASRRIDRLTGQWFFPRWESLAVDGDGSALLRHPTQIPILEVRRLEVSEQLLAADEFALRERYVELIASEFPVGRANVDLEGVFGWIQRCPEVAGELAAPAVAGATTLTLTTDSIRPKDALLLDDRVPAIAVAVDGFEVTIDPLPEDVAAGATAITYGRVPRLIERACIMLVLRTRHGLATEEGVLLAREARMVEERTDNYRYRLGSPADSATAGAGDVTSGDTEVDHLLADFVAPPYVGVV